MLRLGATEQGITEILAIAEHVTSIGAAAAGLRLRTDVPAAVGTASGEPAHSRGAATDVEPLLAEIAEWAREALRIDHVPVFWRSLARRPRLLEAVWNKHRLVISPSELSGELKAAVALAVAMNARSDYWIGYFERYGRVRAGFDDDHVLEVAAAVLHYNAFNTISHGMMLKAPHRDIVASEFAPEAPSRRE